MTRSTGKTPAPLDLEAARKLTARIEARMRQWGAKTNSAQGNKAMRNRIGTAAATPPDRQGRTDVRASVTVNGREFSIMFDYPPATGSRPVRLFEHGSSAGGGTASLIAATGSTRPTIAAQISGALTVSLELTPDRPYQNNQPYTVYAVSVPVLSPSPHGTLAPVKSTTKGPAAPRSADPLAEKAKTWAFDKPAQPAKPARMATAYKAAPPRIDPLERLTSALVDAAHAVKSIAQIEVKERKARAAKLDQLQAARRGVTHLLGEIDKQIEEERTRAFWPGN